MSQDPSAVPRRSWFTLWVVALAVVLILPRAQAGAGSEAAARAVVEHLQTALLEAMRTPAYQERYRRLAPVIEQTHDLDLIARAALGRDLWSDLDTRDRDRYLDLFRKMSIATYAREFSGFSGERFEIVSVRPVRRKGVLVRTLLHKADGGTVELDYHLRERNGQWRIVNVLSDGVSDLALKRDQYRAVVRDRGFGGLLAELEAQSRPPSATSTP